MDNIFRKTPENAAREAKFEAHRELLELRSRIHVIRAEASVLLAKVREVLDNKESFLADYELLLDEVGQFLDRRCT